MSDEERDERPAFARAYPPDPRLDDLVVAFARGNFRRVREEALPLAESADDPRVAEAARDLRRRIDPAPGALYLIALGVALLAYLFLHYRAHAAP